MGEIEIIPGPSEEEMMARARSLADLPVDAVPPLADHEFGLADFAARYGLRVNKAARELARLVAEGILGRGDRIDPRTGRRVKGYWRMG